MTRTRRPPALLPLLVGVAVAALAAAPAQTECPQQSNAPHCAAEPDSTDSSGTDQGNRPTAPPGQATEPDASEPHQERTDPQPERTDPQPDHGADTPSEPAPGPAADDTTGGAPPVTTPRTTSPPAAPGSGPSRPAPPITDDRVDDAGEDAGAPIPPPPPDLGARRILETRLLTSLDGRSVAVAVAVEEARAHGVDGGWTVTVTGPSHGADSALAVGARATRPDGDVGLIIGRTHAAAGAMGFSVVGQRSTTVYDAAYDGMLPVGPFPDGAPPVITVTLFQ